jgi:ABC-type glycerol-3-phosphate transport system substrate-binding protein
MNRIPRMALVALFALVALSFLQAGGQQAGTGEGKAMEEPKLLRIRSVDWLTQKAFIGEAADKFMSEHPGMKVTFESFSGVDVNKYIIQWSSGKSDMDLLVVENPEDTTPFIMKDMLYSFDELGFWERFPKDKLVEAILNVGTIRDQVFYLPIMGEIYWINTNIKLLKDAGVTDADGNVPYPQSWEELLQMAAKATVGKRAGMSIRLDLGSMENSLYSALKGLRGSFFKEDGVTFVVDTPETREILQAWRKGVDNGWITTMTMTDRNAGRVAYVAGKLALLYESGSRWPEAAPALGSNNTGPLPYPGGLEGGSMLFVAGFAIPKESEAPQTALQFIQEIYMTDLFQSKMLNVYGKMPSLKSSYAFASTPKWEEMLTATRKSVPAPQYREHTKFTDALGDNIQAYLLGKQDLDATLNKVQQSLDTIDKRIY